MYAAAKDADMWNMILDTTGVANHDHGPFLSLAHFNESKECIEKFTQVVLP